MTKAAAQELVYKKSNNLIVMIPSINELTTLSRKIYTVLLWETQNQCQKIMSSTRQEPSATHTFEARLADLFSMVDEDYKDFYSRAKKNFLEMRRTEVEWKPSEKGIEDAWGNLGLLSQVKIFRRNNEMIGQWALPPEIMSLLINHGQYTLIDLKQIVKLKSYAAIALYEIFARYKTVPGGCTSKHSPEWWTTAISHKPRSRVSDSRKAAHKEISNLTDIVVKKPEEKGDGPRVRDWRKVKYETILPALEEISSLTDIVVEKPEEIREGPRNSVTEVYFKIKKKSSEAVQEGKLPIELVEMASKLRVALPSVKQVVTDYPHGDRIAMAALQRLEAEINKQGADAIESPTGYFRTIVDSLAIHVSTKPSVEPKKPSVEPELKQSASDEIRKIVTELQREEQLELLDRAVDLMGTKGLFSPQTRLKYKEFKEGSGLLTPVLLNYMVEVYKSDQPVVQAKVEIAD